jgi:four helix bundle protein
MADKQQIEALKKRSFDLTCAVVKAYPKQKYLDDASRIIWRQLLRAVSSSTFNLEEAQAGSSDADFLAKMRIALREARETRIAIRVIVACELAAHATVGRYEDEARQLAAIFGSIIVNKRKNMKKKPPPDGD